MQQHKVQVGHLQQHQGALHVPDNPLPAPGPVGGLGGHIQLRSRASQARQAAPQPRLRPIDHGRVEGGEAGLFRSGDLHGIGQVYLEGVAHHLGHLLAPPKEGRASAKAYSRHRPPGVQDQASSFCCCHF